MAARKKASKKKLTAEQEKKLKRAVRAEVLLILSATNIHGYSVAEIKDKHKLWEHLGIRKLMLGAFNARLTAFSRKRGGGAVRVASLKKQKTVAELQALVYKAIVEGGGK